MKRKDCYIMRKVAGKHVIMPTGDESFRFEGIISINETGALLWDTLADDVSEQELVAAVRAVYDVSEREALEDIRDFISTAKKANLIE